MPKKKKLTSTVIFLCILLLVVCVIGYDWEQRNDYQKYNTSSLSYVSAKVLSVMRENLTKDRTDEHRYLGTQEVVVRIDEGVFEGQEKTIINYLSTSSNVRVLEGERIIVCVDSPLNAQPYFTIYNYDRSFPLGLIFLGFVAGILLVGGKKGLKSLEGLVLTMISILFFLIPGIYHGIKVIPLTVVTLLAVIFMALFLMNGLQQKTILFAGATGAGVLVAAIFCAVCEKLLKVNGYYFSEVESLLLIAQSTGLEVKHLLFAGVLISSMGAVMDVGVSIVSALYEVKRANFSQGPKELFKAGMNMGKDMIGTMSNTLILAFTGTSLTTMLLLIAFGYQPLQLLNSDYLAIELVRGISSTFAVVMTVPLASAMGAIFIKREHVEGIADT